MVMFVGMCVCGDKVHPLKHKSERREGERSTEVKREKRLGPRRSEFACFYICPRPLSATPPRSGVMANTTKAQR